MRHLVLILLTCMVSISFAQEDKEQRLALKKANNYVFEANSLINEDDFVSGEMAYRQAISKQPNTVAGIYNLGNAYYKKGNFEEALYRHEQAAKATTSKAEKHKAYHNIGNILMQNKKCKEAVEAFKNALRNDPTDDETRYNLGLAKVCAEEQKDQEDENKDDKNKDENKEDQDKKENEDKKDKEGDDKEDEKDKGDQEKKEGEDEKDDKGKPKDEKEDKGKGEDDKKKEQQKPKPQPGQMSPQQIKNLLEAMNNQEQKVQEKMNAVKEKGAKVKTEKDW
ncbi:tetratricopeptide repeat protein [Flavivirga spongiicola]|uniref:Tetratricopeptide repeat protein n=1 Tax=Flavivirga spongiicola TaxID=421621 RepID=A0ABU7XTR9_9FLAO|nr:tetratricopeptide repeat protein [Flavivirga sp. MEBiC05379]MDO5979151.1 tetratricopeptide repeat protein [Flavivirga sp. MEBiC05379]